jgi:hypothetical protein
MATDFIPAADADLLAWSDNFSQMITATPTAFGLTAANATTLQTRQSAYATAFEAATDPATRGGSTVLAKDIARADLVSYCRALARAVQGTLTVTNQQRFDLGLTVRDTEPSPIPPPANAPGLDVVSVAGNSARIRLHDTANPSRRGKPLGVAGASVFSFVGAAAPAELSQWKFEGNTTRTTVIVDFPAQTPPGAKVWFTAFWFNPRAQGGPTTTPVGTNIPGGAAQAA